MNDKPIFSHVIKEQLENLGFTVKNERPDYFHPNKRVYFFEATPELLQAFDCILKGKPYPPKE